MNKGMVIAGIIIGIAFLLMFQEGDGSTGSAVKAKRGYNEKESKQTVDSFFKSLGGEQGSFEELQTRYAGERQEPKELLQEGMVKCERTERGTTCVREVMMGRVINRIVMNTEDGKTQVSIQPKEER